ncbi:uncharacterized protein EI90DRAFT_3053761 [Cantharellus anzutake]|uniref:uncharacterized protein n=1 Tax=Cantharellus anzutake TaxID=1750568 RepID=UPI001904F05F|nr:uncharacterized protein EI90DRAFT_3053761 [Cantharellus anzutake]KAF8332614.1 hypothetical protein EI90DRAFT_3053761 [Cantharellus anzutake]
MRYFSVLASLVSVCAAVTKRVVSYEAPVNHGGSQLTRSGEPLNIIISALSSPHVLSTVGVEEWANSIHFSKECLGFHIGDPQTANLGDGQGWVTETAVIRYDFGIGYNVGSCLESLTGGDHFRFWQQSTTGAIFLAASVEKSPSERHTIAANGYDDVGSIP